MLTLNQIISQITTLAGAHSQIASSGVGDFAEWQAEERTYPILWVFHEDSVIQDRYLTHNIRLICADLVIAGEEGEDTDGHEQEVLSDTQLILLDFLAYFNNQYSQTYDIVRSATIEPFTESYRDRVAGNSVVIQIRQTFEWDKCSIPQSGAVIPPTVDGLTLYDFSDPTVFARLTNDQLTDLEALICNVSPVTVTVNGDSLGATGSVTCGSSLDIDVTQSGSPVGSWNGSAWIIPPATPFNVSASIDDNTPNFGQSVTLTASGTGLSGVTWYADGHEIGTGTPLVWTVNQSGTYNILAVATNGSEYAEDTISVTASLNQLISTDANGHRWWDFSQTGTLTGDPVQTIADALGSGDDLTQASVALRPARSTVNGLTCAVFDRTVGDYLEKTGGSTTNYAETTMIFAFKPTEVYTNTTDRLFFVRKNGQNDFNGANSIAFTNLLVQCLGGTKRSNFGTGLHIKIIQLSVAGAYLKERLYSNHDYIENQVTLTASQLGLIFEIMRWGGQVSEIGFEWQVFTRILTNNECDTEANKLRWKLGGELT